MEDQEVWELPELLEDLDLEVKREMWDFQDLMDALVLQED